MKSERQLLQEQRIEQIRKDAAELGFHVSTGFKTETEGHRAGQRLHYVTIGYFDEPQEINCQTGLPTPSIAGQDALDQPGRSSAQGLGALPAQGERI